MATFRCGDAVAAACLMAGLEVTANIGSGEGRYRVTLPDFTGGRQAKRLAGRIIGAAVPKAWGSHTAPCQTCGQPRTRHGWVVPRTVAEAVSGVRATIEIAQSTFPPRGSARTPADPASRNTARKLRRKKLSRGLRSLAQRLVTEK